MEIQKCVYWGTATFQDWTIYLAATDLGLGLVTWPDESFESVEKWVKRFLPTSTLVYQPDRIDSYREALLNSLQQGIPEKNALSFDLHGTDFQIEVWNALRTIEPGSTRTYGEIAAIIGRPDAVRAAARAIGANPIAFLIPCHRVIGKDGSLTGYRGGLLLKESLLRQEGITLKASPA